MRERICLGYKACLYVWRICVCNNVIFQSLHCYEQSSVFKRKALSEDKGECASSHNWRLNSYVNIKSFTYEVNADDKNSCM